MIKKLKEPETGETFLPLMEKNYQKFKESIFLSLPIILS